MKIISEIQRKTADQKEEPSICITACLTETQKKEIQALGRACQAWEPVTQEPFLDNEENADPAMPCFYIYYENTFPISFLSLFVPDGSYAEVTGFTLPGYRGKGRFHELLACAQEELKDRGLDWYLVSDGKSADAQVVLAHKQLEAEYSEMMMAAPMAQLAQLSVKKEKDAEGPGLEDFQIEKEGEEYLLKRKGQQIGHCRLAFFPGTAYLYGFTIEEGLRRQGYGRLFLKLLAQSQPEEIHTMLLQVGSRNEAACSLYNGCGFSVTEQLNYYRIS